MTIMLQDSNGEVITLVDVDSVIFNGVGDPIVRINGNKELYENTKIIVITD